MQVDVTRPAGDLCSVYFRSMRSIDPEAIAAVFSIIDADDSGKMEHDEFESTVQVRPTASLGHYCRWCHCGC